MDKFMMPKRDIILGAIALSVVLTVVFSSFVISTGAMEFKAEAWTAIATIGLVAATVVLAYIAYTQKTSAEQLAQMQVNSAKELAQLQVDAAKELAERQEKAADGLATRQTYSLKWMEEQKTRPYCDFVVVLNTATKTPVGVYLKNLGHGPALKMLWKIYPGGDLITETGRGGIERVASKFGLEGWIEVYVPNRMAASSEINIFRIRDGVPDNIPPSQAEDERTRAIEQLRQMINAMNIELEVHSIMGQKDTLWMVPDPGVAES